MLELLVHLQHVALVTVFVVVDHAQQLDLVKRLINLVLVVGNDLHAHKSVRDDVFGHYALAESSGTQLLDVDVPARYHTGLIDRKVFGLLETCLLPVLDDPKVE